MKIWCACGKHMLDDENAPQGLRLKAEQEGLNLLHCSDCGITVFSKSEKSVKKAA